VTRPAAAGEEDGGQTTKDRATHSGLKTDHKGLTNLSSLEEVIGRNRKALSEIVLTTAG
jgi:hypothetical protein